MLGEYVSTNQWHPSKNTCNCLYQFWLCGAKISFANHFATSAKPETDQVHQDPEKNNCAI